jgi:spore coat polysaccharide biosynthesis protein SpsF
MKIIGIIQARINSKRLPGKVLLNINEKPMLWHIYQRMKNSKTLDEVVISTGDSKENKKIIKFSEDNNIPFFSGNENDLIDRLYKTAINFKADAIVRVTGDCPLIDSDIIDELVMNYKKNESFDIITNCITESFPHGLDAEVYSTKVLKKMHSEIKEEKFREWFVLYVRNHFKEFEILEIKNKTDQSRYRWTVDYLEDLEFVRQIFKNLYDKKKMFMMNDIFDLLNKKPNLERINSKFMDCKNINAPEESI